MIYIIPKNFLNFFIFLKFVILNNQTVKEYEIKLSISLIITYDKCKKLHSKSISNRNCFFETKIKKSNKYLRSSICSLTSNFGLAQQKNLIKV